VSSPDRAIMTYMRTIYDDDTPKMTLSWIVTVGRGAAGVLCD
jgi:hypothetical protein